RFRLDVVNIQYQSAAYGLHPAINLLPHLVREVPMVVTFHDLRPPYLFPKAGRLRDRAVLALAQGARAVIVTNAQDRQRLVGQHGIRRFEMIPIGSNISATLPRRYDRTVWRMRWNLPEEALVLCYFGFLNASKGGEDLVYALRRLVDGGLDAWLLMIGGAAGASDPTNRVYLQHVRRAIDTLHLADRVVWTGHLADEEVSACFALADICVLPYRDGLSFRRGSLIAALVHGMPIISTYPDGGPDPALLPEVRHGENVWLVPPANPAALAEAVRRLAGDPELRRRLGEGARALSKQFDWVNIAQRTLQLLNEVVHG
ncbi:MAG: glycosyltransferase family 4 protein, partial [Chloroflexi bacterium]|nr:glycosyltransferase family 4 protein [Chloroflexota bacterium]